MGEQLRIKGKEAVALAVELDRLTTVMDEFRCRLFKPLPSLHHGRPCDDAGLPL